MSPWRAGTTSPGCQVALIGSGPAALMAAEVLSRAGHSVSIFEKRKSPARKLLIAGSSGLNVTNSLPLPEFAAQYSGPAAFWDSVFHALSPQGWLDFLEKELGIPTFEGTSGRYFVEDLKGGKLVRTWIHRLQERGVRWFFDRECTGIEVDRSTSRLNLSFAQHPCQTLDAACFCLGGGSYEAEEIPLRWPAIFQHHDIGFSPFRPSNVGYRVAWTGEFLKEADRQPIKNIVLTSIRGSRQGEIMITDYGMEGTPVYSVGEKGTVHLDLKPDLTVEQILARCRAVQENLAPLRRVRKQMKLGPAALALLFHFTPPEKLRDLEALARHIKHLPLDFLGPQPLEEAISSAGGIALDEVDSQFMLKKIPGAFAAGEMLDWDAPTGGFLIQACVSQGFAAGHGILQYLAGAGSLGDREKSRG